MLSWNSKIIEIGSFGCSSFVLFIFNLNLLIFTKQPESEITIQNWWTNPVYYSIWGDNISYMQHYYSYSRPRTVFIFVYWSSNVFSSLWIIMWLLISFYLFIFYLLSLVWFVCSFVTEPTSIGLNIGLDKAWDHTSQLAEAEKPSEESGHSFGIPNTTLSLQKHSAYVKELKYGNSSYTACLSPVE